MCSYWYMVVFVVDGGSDPEEWAEGSEDAVDDAAEDGGDGDASVSRGYDQVDEKGFLLEVEGCCCWLCFAVCCPKTLQLTILRLMLL